MDWTIEQALDAFDKTPVSDGDVNYPQRICELLLGKVDLATVLQVLDAATSAYQAGVDTAY